MANYPKNRKSSPRAGCGAGVPRSKTTRTCRRCSVSFMGYGGSGYCSRKCMFLSNVLPQENGCWTWKGYKRPNGYGEAYFGRNPNRERVLAHRLAYEVMHGDPGSLCVCHKCDTPSCVNPDHLFLGTKAENSADRNAKGRQARGERNGPAKLTETQVRAIRADARGCRKLAREFGVDAGTIMSIRRRKTWAHVE